MYHIGHKAVESTHQSNNIDSTVGSRIKGLILYSNQHRQLPPCRTHVLSKKPESESQAEEEGRERNPGGWNKTKGEWLSPQEASLAKS